MPIRYFATNRRRDDLAGLIKESSKAAFRKAHRGLMRGGYYFVDMDAYMNTYLETTDDDTMPIPAVVKESGTEIYSDFLEHKNVDQILVCVHGFNVELSGALDWYGVLMDTMQHAGAPLAFSPADLNGTAKKTAVIGFSWPSNGRVIDYMSDQSDAMKSTTAFCSLLARLKLTGKDVSLICHSMGNFMAGHALSDLASGAQQPPILARFAAGGDDARAALATKLIADLDKASDGQQAPWIKTMIMLAPDVERRHVSSCAEPNGNPTYEGPFFHGLDSLVGKSVNVYSRYDGALNISNLEKSVREKANGALSVLTLGLVDYFRRNPDMKWEQRLGLGRHPVTAPASMVSLNAAEMAARPVDHGDHVDSPAIAAALNKLLF